MLLILSFGGGVICQFYLPGPPPMPILNADLVEVVVVVLADVMVLVTIWSPSLSPLVISV